MTSKLKCPFCKEELSYAQEIDGGFEILTCDCPHGIWLFGNDKMWHNLEKVITELERTRKALDIAIERLNLMSRETFQGEPSSINMGFHVRAAAALTDIDEIIAEQKDK